MQLTTFISASVAIAATLVSGGAVLPVTNPAVAPVKPATAAPAGGASVRPKCPPTRPDYSGWFDKTAKIAPQCKPHVAKPGVIVKPTCPRNKVAYCARDPYHFAPYNSRNDFCLNNGVNRVQCFDQDLDDDAITELLQDVFAVLEDVLELLGLECVLNGDVASCDESLLEELVGSDLEEILESVGDLLDDLLGDLLGRRAPSADVPVKARA